jgi:hypothetical protein
MNNMKTQSTYTVGRTVLNENGDRVVEHEERVVTVSLHVTEDKRVFWKGARVA